MRIKFWTPEEDNYLKKHYSDNSQKKLAIALNRTVSAIQNRGLSLGLHKSEEYMSNPDNLSMFQKGHTSHNKGKKMSAEMYAKCKATMFQKGSIPKNTAKVGEIRENYNRKRKTCYLQIKIEEPNKWKFLHRYIWENHNGPIPKKSNVIFKDGNSFNCDISNLELITNQEKMKRNSIHNQYPKELAETIQLLGALKRRINDKETHD